MVKDGIHFASKVAIAAASVFAAPIPALAQEARYHFDIPAQNLDGALKAFGRVTQLPLVYSGPKVRRARSSSVKGDLSAANALAQLLVNSGFIVRVGRSGVYMIEPAPTLSSESDDQNGTGIADILIVGRRTLNADVKRSKDDTQPYIIISGQDIQNSGVTNLEDYLRTRLPMNTQVGSTNQPRYAGQAGIGSAGGITLRGLSTSQTLILVDGRRQPGVAVGSGDGNGQPNINGIPPSAIERIEVLPATAGGIYGGGAVGGVINIILKRDYRGLDVEAIYGSPFDVRVPYAAFSASGGFSIGDLTSISFSASYSHQGELDGSERNFQSRARELNYQNFPSDFQSILSANVANVCSSNQNYTYCQSGLSNLVLKNGMALNSQFTSVPRGYTGPGVTGTNDGGAALADRAGRQDLSTPKGLYTLYSGPELQSYSVSARHRFAGGFEVYADLGLNQTRTTSTTVPVQNILLPANDPNNPFVQPIAVSLVLKEAPQTLIAKVNNKRASVGAIKHFGTWTASIEHNWSRSVTSSILDGALYLYGGDLQAYLRSVALSDRPISRNDLIANGAFSVANALYPASDTLNDSLLRLSGNVFHLPGGAVTFNGYAERRDERLGASLRRLDFSRTTGPYTYTYFAPKRQEVLSGYGEIRLPIISPKLEVPFVNELELFGALRHDDYKTFTSSNGGLAYGSSPDGPFGPFAPIRNRVASTDYTVGVKFSPIKDIALRASYGTSFLPPSLGQLYGSTYSINLSSNYDPRRGNTPLGTDVLETGGGNANLQSERAKSLSIGAILTPSLIPKLRVSVDYTSIRKSGEISTVPGDVEGLLAYESLFPSRITRAPLTAQDQALGYTGGVITALDDTLTNIAGTTVKAIDIQLDYELDAKRFGVFRPSLLVSHQFALSRQVIAGTPFLNAVGFADGPLTWAGNAGVTWSLGRWSAGWNAQYYNDYNICNSFDSAETCTDSRQRQGATSVPSQIYNDLYVSFRLGKVPSSALSNLQLTLGIQNVFNASPPIIATTYGLGYDPRGDPRLRRFTLKISKHFGR